VLTEKELNMKSKLLASALGVAVLGTSAVALADNGRGHDRRPAYHGHHDAGRPVHSVPRYWSHHRRPVVYKHWHGPAWRAPYYRPYDYAPRPYSRYDDGVTIIFKGRID
jgi:hypothetical protein